MPTSIYDQSLQYQYPTGVDPNDPSTWYSYSPFGDRTPLVNFDGMGMLDTQSYLKNINNLVADKPGYTTYIIPSAKTGIDNKDQLISFARQYGMNPDGTQASDATFGSMVYIPTDKMQSAPKAIDYNPSVDKDWGPTLGALFLGGVGLASGGLGSLFGGTEAVGGASGAAGSTLADLYGAATGTSVAAAPTAATGSALYSAATGALPAVAGLQANPLYQAATSGGSSPMDWTDLFSGGGYSPDPNFSGISDLYGAATNQSVPTDWASSLASGFSDNQLYSAVTSGGGDILDLVKQYGQPAAKALGLTNSDGSIDWGRILKGAGETALGMYGANQSADAMERISDKYMALGDPYRKRLADLYANPDSFLTSKEVTTPVDQGTNALARALSVKGNPTGSGTALQEMQNYSSNMLFGKLGDEKTRLGALGGLTQMPASVGMGADMSAAQSQGSGLNALGYGLNSIINPSPQTSLSDLYKQFSNSLK